MKRCPYCFEALARKSTICPHCSQFLIDDIVNVDYNSADTKHCLFCGKDILTEAIVCKHCHRWVDEIDDAVDSSP